MSVELGLILGILILLIVCVIIGLVIGLGGHDEKMDFTLYCPSCNGDDFKEQGNCYQCQDCAQCLEK